jgi:hypothetical protein
MPATSERSSNAFVDAVLRLQAETVTVVNETVEETQRQFADLVAALRATVLDAADEASSSVESATELARKLAYASIGLAVVVGEEVVHRAADLPVVAAVRDVARR